MRPPSISRRCLAAGSPTAGSACSARSSPAACSSRSAISRSRCRPSSRKAVVLSRTHSHRARHRLAQAEHLGDRRRPVSAKAARAATPASRSSTWASTSARSSRPLITGVLGERVGWHWGFGAAGVGMLIGVITYRLRAPKTLGSIGTRTVDDATPREHRAGAADPSLAALAVLARRRRAGDGRRGPRSTPSGSRRQMAIIIVAWPCSTSPTCSCLAASRATSRSASSCIHRAVRVRGDLLGGVRAGADVAQSVRARLHRIASVFGWEMPSSWLQAANSVFVVVARAGVRGDLDRAGAAATRIHPAQPSLRSVCCSPDLGFSSW